MICFQEPIKNLVARGHRIDIRDFELASAERISSDLQPTTLSLLLEARALLSDLLHDCASLAPSESSAEHGTERVRTSYLPFERAVDATVEASKRGSAQVVEEIAFTAQLELRQRAERLERVRPAQGTVTLLGECDSSLRRMRKALCAVDITIANVTGVAPLLDFTSELETSLAVRSAYAKFRARLAPEAMPEPSALRSRFRAAGTQLAMLVGWDVYPDLRVRDRLLLREFQQRILAWLRGADDASLQAGERLWQDFTACIEMLGFVNRRQELIEHDVRVARQLLAGLSTCPEHALPDASAYRALEELEGLDPELDELLSEPRHSCGVLASVLTRVVGQLGPPTCPPCPGEQPW